MEERKKKLVRTIRSVSIKKKKKKKKTQKKP